MAPLNKFIICKSTFAKPSFILLKDESAVAVRVPSKSTSATVLSLETTSDEVKLSALKFLGAFIVDLILGVRVIRRVFIFVIMVRSSH